MHYRGYRGYSSHCVNCIELYWKVFHVSNLLKFNLRCLKIEKKIALITDDITTAEISFICLPASINWMWLFVINWMCLLIECECELNVKWRGSCELLSNIKISSVILSFFLFIDVTVHGQQQLKEKWWRHFSKLQCDSILFKF